MSRRKTTKIFIQESINKYGLNRFDYSKTQYIKNDFKVIITCPVHNLDFEQTPSNHLSFIGCSKCVAIDQHLKFAKTTEQFIQDAKKIHQDKYEYTLTNYINNHTKIIIICRVHGEFLAIPSQHLNGVDCAKCAISKLPGGLFDKYFDRFPDKVNQESILYFVKFTDKTSNFTFFKLGVTTQDIERRFAGPAYSGFDIETIWESKGPLKLVHALEIALKRIYSKIRINVEYIKFHGYTECFSEQIPKCEILSGTIINFDSEYLNILISRILIKSGICEYKLQARKLRIEELDSKTANAFFEANHIQGSCQASHAFGLIDASGELVCAMSLGKPRFNRKFEFELIRLATKKFTVVAGGASKLFKYFTKKYIPSSVISYSDRSWNEGKIYTVLGFTKMHTSNPNYWYVREGIRFSRMKCQKHKLEKLLGTNNFNPLETEAQNMFRNGFSKESDSGQDVFVVHFV